MKHKKLKVMMNLNYNTVNHLSVVQRSDSGITTIYYRSGDTLECITHKPLFQNDEIMVIPCNSEDIEVVSTDETSGDTYKISITFMKITNVELC